MEFLKKLFNFDDQNLRKGSWTFGQSDHHDEHEDDHDDDHDEHHDDDHDKHNLNNHSRDPMSNPVMPSTGLICARCSTQLVQGAKFCHQCGMTMEQKVNCASCGSPLPANTLFCPQCGDKNG